MQYKQWASVDKTKLVTVTDTCNDFVEKLAKKLKALTRHHHTTKSQSSYLKLLKDKLPTNEITVQGDFAENYSFVIQDEAQGFHWDTSQATLHPFVAYFRATDGSLKHANFCMISDTTVHNTATVYSFQCKLIQQIKALLPHVNKIH